MADYAYNRKAQYDFEILEKFEAGVELLGPEVKSIKNGRVSLDGAFVIARGGELYVKGIFIPPYQEKNQDDSYDPHRVRKLLLNRDQIDDIVKAVSTRGLTGIPISMYNKNRHIKCQIAIVKGKKNYDKRESIKRRDIEREIGRKIK